MSKQMSEKKLFVLFMDNPQIGLTHGPQIQLVTLEMLEKRPGYSLSDIEDIDQLKLHLVWHDRCKPAGIMIWRVK